MKLNPAHSIFDGNMLIIYCSLDAVGGCGRPFKEGWVAAKQSGNQAIRLPDCPIDGLEKRIARLGLFPIGLPPSIFVFG